MLLYNRNMSYVGKEIMATYYDGTKLLSMKDLKGETPEIFMTTTNRSAGKTTYFGRLAIRRFLKNKSKFLLLYRFNYELTSCSDKFFKDLQKLFFSNYEMSEKRMANGIYVELYLNDEPCGYATALNYADQLKKFSHLLSDVDMIIFDEFQSETNHYCPNEINKFLSIHTSVARGGGDQVRYLPVYMISNAVSLINPYYLSLGIADRLQKDTKYLKGDGFVLEQGFYEEVAKEQLDSGFNRAFKNEKYVAYSSQNIYLNDNACLIEKLKGPNRYICTIKRGNQFYSLKNYIDENVYYIDNTYDETCPQRLTISANDQEVGFKFIGPGSLYISMLKRAFECGRLRFKNQQCKALAFEIMKYNLFD